MPTSKSLFCSQVSYTWLLNNSVFCKQMFSASHVVIFNLSNVLGIFGIGLIDNNFTSFELFC